MDFTTFFLLAVLVILVVCAFLFVPVLRQYADNLWISIKNKLSKTPTQRGVTPSDSAQGPVAQTPLYRQLRQATDRSLGYSSSIEYWASVDELDQFSALSWCALYVPLAEKYGLYSFHSQAANVASTASAGVFGIVGGAAGGPAGMGIAFLRGTINTVGAVLQQAASVAAYEKQQDVANREIIAKIGPPPLVLDDILFHIASMNSGEQDLTKLRMLYFEPPSFRAYGPLLLLHYARIWNWPVIPLKPEHLAEISSWTMGGIPVSPGLMIDGASWQQSNARNREQYALIQHYQKLTDAYQKDGYRPILKLRYDLSLVVRVAKPALTDTSKLGV